MAESKISIPNSSTFEVRKKSHVVSSVEVFSMHNKLLLYERKERDSRKKRGKQTTFSSFKQEHVDECKSTPAQIWCSALMFTKD